MNTIQKLKFSNYKIIDNTVLSLFIYCFTFHKYHLANSISKLFLLKYFLNSYLLVFFPITNLLNPFFLPLQKSRVFYFKNKAMEFGVLILGIVAGILSGLFGIGGGIIMVPTLIAVFGLEMLNANATSLAAMLLPVGIFGVITYYKAGYINVRNALWISVGLLIGSFFGAELAVSVDVKVLSKLYAAFLLYIAIGYLNIPTLFQRNETPIIDPIITIKKVKYSFWIFIVVGVFAGVIAGLFGKGGGLVIVPVLIKFFKYDAKSAAATSLAALQLPVGLPSVIVYAQAGYLNWVFAGLMAVGIVIGVFFGTKLALKLPAAMFKKVYAFFLLGVAVYMVYKYI